MKKEAIHYEDTFLREGMLGRCGFFLGTGLVIVGLLAPMIGYQSLFSSRRPASASLDPGRGSSFDVGSGISDYGLPASQAQEEVRHLSLDFSLVLVLVAVLALCLLPNLMRSESCASPWAAQPQTPGSPRAAPTLGPGLLQDSARGRVVDVKPGEIGLGSGISAQSPLWGLSSGGQGRDWGSARAWGSSQAMPWTAGSWATPVPSPYGSAALGASPWGSAGPAGYSSGAVPAPAASLWPPNRFAQVFGALGRGLGSQAAPSEADVMETYANFGVELQQWAPAVMQVLDRELLQVFLRELEHSDLVLQQGLGGMGWRLSYEAPRLSGMSGLGLAFGAQELSIFDRNLPKPLCDNPQLVPLWQKRQQLEAFLMHPLFEPGQRHYVLERLREWRQRGLSNAMRAEFRASQAMPTDGHILENLVVKMLDWMMGDFSGCFLSVGQVPPRNKHLGQAPSAYLRQVVDQSVFPKPMPHYEVVTLQKTWRLRPGSTNLPEALALLMNALRRQSRSYQSFPQPLRAAIEGQKP